ncbi:hypothetical protein L7H23_00880 [Sphingopyxis sp. BSN-002]|uniref:hypothetical protein n=1 Tax=Sphingopyxis sp. BSN-002 TaxID=2911495 RepID=UPI001EDC9301|nr:hypothetical protein [Sphingopyxis sp. BSN-002]UKK84688.1 hypothetical protein L7H23_00880 [Sphingopyxis sp. BSN-002]
MSSSPAEIAQAEYEGLIFGTYATWVILLVGGIVVGRILAKRKGVRMVWWPVLVTVIFSGLGMIGFDPSEKKREVFKNYGVEVDG